MKTRFLIPLLALAFGASVAVAQNRVIPSDPGADSGNTGADGAGTSVNNRAGAERAGTEGAVTRGTTTSSLPRDQRRFFEKLSRINEQELALSRIAAQQAATPQVRAFATDMVKDHTLHGEELTRLATRKGATLRTLDAKKVAGMEKEWAEKKGRNFDQSYVEAAVEAHEDTLDVLENGVRSSDPDVVALSHKLLPKIRAHLERARSLAQALE